MSDRPSQIFPESRSSRSACLNPTSFSFFYFFSVFKPPSQRIYGTNECYDLSPGQSYYFQLPSISWHIQDFEKLRLSGGRSIDSGWKFIVKDYERVIRRFTSVFILYNILPRYVRRIYINKSSYLASDVCIDAQTEIVCIINFTELYNV